MDKPNRELALHRVATLGKDAVHAYSDDKSYAMYLFM